MTLVNNFFSNFRTTTQSSNGSQKLINRFGKEPSKPSDPIVKRGYAYINMFENMEQKVWSNVKNGHRADSIFEPENKTQFNRLCSIHQAKANKIRQMAKMYPEGSANQRYLNLLASNHEKKLENFKMEKQMADLDDKIDACERRGDSAGAAKLEKQKEDLQKKIDTNKMFISGVGVPAEYGRPSPAVRTFMDNFKAQECGPIKNGYKRSSENAKDQVRTFLG